MTDLNTKFFVFIDAGENDVGKIREELLKNKYIVLVHCPLGPTDIICAAEAESIEQMRDVVLPKIHELLEFQHHPIKHTETMLVLDCLGQVLTRENNNLDGMGVWILANVAVNDSSIVEKFLKISEHVVAVFNVIGRYDTIVYVEAPNLEAIHKVLDNGIRNLRAFAKRGTMQAIQSTDSRIVLNYDRGY